MKSQQQINDEIHIALFGNADTGELGVVQKTNEIYQILSAFRFFGRAVMWCALVIGAVGAAVESYFQIVKHFIKGK